jgi:hypothetical protein
MKDRDASHKKDREGVIQIIENRKRAGRQEKNVVITLNRDQTDPKTEFPESCVTRVTINFQNPEYPLPPNLKFSRQPNRPRTLKIKETNVNKRRKR